MEDLTSRQRVARPASAASSRTQTSRMTPTSSNNSSANLPFRGASGGSLLQERLRERKVRRRSVDLSERGVQSSPVRGINGKDDKRPTSSGKGMGVKQMEDQVSTLHKQNFDLKLELFHRRQRQEKLEEMLATAEKRIEEQGELQEVNEELLEELEKRDQALDEAVGLIVTLEDKIARLMDERAGVRAYDEQSYLQDNHESISSSPPRHAPKKLPRMPSFLSDQSEGTEALRSLYIPHEGSLPKLSEEGMMDAMDSPRLSVLSESSFISVYGEKKIPQLSLDDDTDIIQKHQASSNTEKWVDERPVPTRTPLRSSGKSQYLSLNDIIASPLQRLEKLQSKMEKLPSINTHKSSFEDRQGLPPTPDTFSTSTLQTKRNFTSSTETLHKNAITSYPNQSTTSVRPRSAGETVTSRRDGHGWDTPTETNTDAGSVISAISNSYRPNRITAPNLFSFAPGEWGQDVMFNHDPAPPVPTHRRLRRLSVGEEPKSNNSVRNNSVVTRYGDLSQYGTSPIDTTPKPALPDRRSSLNAAVKSRRSHQNSSNSSNSPSSMQATPGAGSNTASTPVKRSRISSSFGIFRRSEASPLSNVHSSPVAAPRPPQNTRSYTYSDSNTEDDSRISATPPPIRRNRTTNYRPSSAETGANMESRGFDAVDTMSGMNRDLITERREARRERTGSMTIATKEVDEKEEGGKGRIGKWLGLSAGGLRRN